MKEQEDEVTQTPTTTRTTTTTTTTSTTTTTTRRTTTTTRQRPRRGKRERGVSYNVHEKKNTTPSEQQQQQPAAAAHGGKSRTRRASAALQKHGSDAPSGGIQALLPSVIGLAVLVCGVMAKMGFRGRATVAGIDLGTTNSVICVQAPAKGIGEIDCIDDPATGSPIVPSVVHFLEVADRPVGPSSKVASTLTPHPSAVLVGREAKRRIDSHPHHTLYNAKRVIGRPYHDPAVKELSAEVEFVVREEEEDKTNKNDGTTDNDESSSSFVSFSVPDTDRPISPWQVGAYVVNHLMKMTKEKLGHENVKSAVICVPAKFNDVQRAETFKAFRAAGVSVARVVEEPTAAALAYGLHKKDGVDYIMVYDFGGGTLDVSLLSVSEGFVDVMGSDGDDLLGGADFDAAVAHFLLDQQGTGQDTVDRVSTAMNHFAPDELRPGVDYEQELSHQCPVLSETPLCTVSSFHTIGEYLKIALSSSSSSKSKKNAADDDDDDETVESKCLGVPATVNVEERITLAEFCSFLEPVRLSLKLSEYNDAVSGLYERSIVPVHRLLSDLDLTVSDIDEVVMVGGTTRMPQIRDLVRLALPTAQLNTHIDPDITVAYGAASVID